MIKQKGFGFTLEALTSLTILVIIISIPIIYNENDLSKIYCLQKENDLIKIWVKTKGFEEKELKNDFKKMFPFQKGEIVVEEKKIVIEGKTGKNALKNTGFYYENGKMKEVSVKVFI